MSYEYAETICGEDLVRYRTKLSVIGMEECPFKIPGNCWKNDPLAWPDVTYQPKIPKSLNSQTSQDMKFLKGFSKGPCTMIGYFLAINIRLNSAIFR